MPPYSVRPNLLPLARNVVLALSKEGVSDERKLRLVRNRITEGQGGILPRNLELVRAYRELLEEGKMDPSPTLLGLIQKRKVRTLSGIANITVLTKDLGCPGQCIFCPTEKGMPKSYLSNEPAMMRAVQNQFDAYRQAKARLNGLMAQGHDTSKIDIRIAGGTWGAVPEKYRQEFLKGIYLALNEGPGALNADHEFKVKSYELKDLVETNETTACRCVGLWVETRPDWVDEEEIRKLRSYGVTGVELGIQTTDDAVNAFNKRGHGLKESVEATRLLRDAGFKVCHHLMPNLPTATLESDLKSGRELFQLEGLRPDYLKVYPMVVTPFSPLTEMLKRDPMLHTAYSDETLMEIITEIKKGIPEYCRVIRVIRDIPAESIVLGSKTSNLRQILQRRGVVCRCVRCREIQDADFKPEETVLNTRRYSTVGGEEVFLSIDVPRLDKIVGLCRLRLPDATAKPALEVLEKAALVRELHVYGRQKALVRKEGLNSKTQHLGFGKKLMEAAEAAAREAGFSKVAVIAATGTREYYKKIGYHLEETYMVKDLK